MTQATRRGTKGGGHRPSAPAVTSTAGAAPATPAHGNFSLSKLFWAAGIILSVVLVGLVSVIVYLSTSDTTASFRPDKHSPGIVFNNPAGNYTSTSFVDADGQTKPIPNFWLDVDAKRDGLEIHRDSVHVKACEGDDLAKVIAGAPHAGVISRGEILLPTGPTGVRGIICNAGPNGAIVFGTPEVRRAIKTYWQQKQAVSAMNPCDSIPWQTVTVHSTTEVYPLPIPAADQRYDVWSEHTALKFKPSANAPWQTYLPQETVYQMGLQKTTPGTNPVIAKWRFLPLSAKCYPG